MNGNTHEVVDCTVRVTPGLARRIRKAAFADQKGRDACAALMIAADCDPGEPDALRSRANELAVTIAEQEQKLSSLKTAADKRAADLAQTRKQLAERDEAVGTLRRELKLAADRIADLEANLVHSVECRDLQNEAIDQLHLVVDTIRKGGDPEAAFLAAAGYDRDAVDDALSSIDQLKSTNADLARKVAPLDAASAGGGLRASIARRILGL